MIKYLAVIDGDKGDYGVVIPDIPGSCNGVGATVDEALRDAEEVLAEFVEYYQAKGVSIPDPSPLEGVELEPGQMVAYVTLKLPVQAER